MANKPFNIEHLQMGAKFSFVGEKEIYTLDEIDSIEVKGKAKVKVKISQAKILGRSKKVIIKSK
jgi:hypothetical protein